jgi:hypothetical protein
MAGSESFLCAQDTDEGYFKTEHLISSCDEKSFLIFQSALHSQKAWKINSSDQSIPKCYTGVFAAVRDVGSVAGR